jgi:septation ring formation regulator EzrA
MNIPAEESRKVSEALQHDLRQRGEQLVQLTGSVSTALSKQSTVHATLQRSAKQFASLQPTIDHTSQLLQQLEKLNAHLRDQTALLVDSVSRVAIVMETSDACATMCRSVALPTQFAVADNADAALAAEHEQQQQHVRASRKPRRSSTDVLRLAFDPADEEDDAVDEEELRLPVRDHQR